jgi:putative DNA primase/helicase
MNLTDFDLTMFAKIRVPPELLLQAKIQRVDDREARDLLALNGTYGRMDGIYFPYFSWQTGFRVAARVRRDHPEIENGKPRRKYMAGYGDRRHLYFPPDAKELIGDSSLPICLVEAEKSVLAIAAWGIRTGTRILPIATAGCWGHRGRVGKTETANGERVDEVGPLPDLAVCAGRRVYILFDANCASNPEVRAARLDLARELRKIKADIQVLELPATERVNGPDDYIGLMGDDAFFRLFDARTKAATTVWTEDDLTLKFTAAYPDLRYVAPWGKWFRNERGGWRDDSVLSVFDRAREICREVSEGIDPKETATLKSLRAAKTRAAIENMARSDPRHAATVDQWDRNGWLLNTPGGTCETPTGALREHRAEDYLTKMTAVTPRIGDCPLWARFLVRITAGDAELERYLQRVCGYCLTGDISEHALFFLYGTGSNGKGVFTSTLLGILADYAQVAQMEVFTENKNDRHPTELAALRGARLVIASEIDAGRRMAEGRVKSLTGGDPIRARFCRCDEFEFTPTFKLMLAGNHKPALRSVDEAIRRRVHLVPFTVTIPPEERDLKLGEKLRAEWPQILQWAINGGLAWQREGLNPPAAVRDATEEYFATEDAIKSWMDERCVVSPQAGTTKTSALYQDYKAWTELAGEFCGSQKNFSQDMKDRGFVIRESSGRSVIDGIAIRNEPAS